MTKTHLQRLNTMRAINNVLISTPVGHNKQLEKYHDQAIGYFLRNGMKKIVNSNGELRFALHDLEDKVVNAADAYVFLPIPKMRNQKMQAQEALTFFREQFKAASLFVGKQTLDPNLKLGDKTINYPDKPIVLINRDGCWDPFLAIMNHLHKLGTVRDKPEDIVHVVDNVGEAITRIKEAIHVPPKTRALHGGTYNFTKEQIEKRQLDPDLDNKPKVNVCVFCSASTKRDDIKQSAFDLGKAIAHEGWGLISGMGKTGMMGTVIDGAVENIKHGNGLGWVGGSNLQRIINMEGLPDYCDKMWLADDIYKRMDIMIEQSQAFVIMPGGMGTVQELMALLLLKYNKEDDKGENKEKKYKMHKKPIVVVNQEVMVDGKPVKFWAPLIEFAKNYGFEDDIKVVDTVEKAMEYLKTQKPSVDPSDAKLRHTKPRQSHYELAV